jgi:hypothetical protein
MTKPPNKTSLRAPLFGQYRAKPLQQALTRFEKPHLTLQALINVRIRAS